MMLVTDLAVLDHTDGTVLLIANALPAAGDAAAYDDAVARLDAMAADLTKAVPPGRRGAGAGRGAAGDAATWRPGVYEDGVERIREHIRAGDAFQVVLAQRFEVETTVDALDLYRVLRATNPSPYMYLLRFAGRETPFDVVGSSPEALVTVTGTSAVVHPPAGTRPRGATEEEDVRLAEGLLADPKERAEHVMLVDLARNDLGRVCVPGHGRGARLHARGALQPRHAPGLDGRRRGRRRARRARRLRRDLPGRHRLRGAQAAGDGDHRVARADPPGALRRHRRLRRRQRRHGHGDRDPHRRAAPGPGLRAGRRRDRGRQRRRRPRRPRPGTRRARCCRRSRRRRGLRELP